MASKTELKNKNKILTYEIKNFNLYNRINNDTQVILDKCKNLINLISNSIEIFNINLNHEYISIPKKEYSNIIDLDINKYLFQYLNNSIKLNTVLNFNTNISNEINENNENYKLINKKYFNFHKKIIRNNKIVYTNNYLLYNKIKNINRKSSKRKSKYRGVSKNGSGWQVIKNKKYIGTFWSEEIAARIYDILSIKKTGINSKTNFVYKFDEIETILKSNIDFKDKNDISRILLGLTLL